MDKKIKVLCYMDAPTCATGFGTVSRNILSGLYNTGRYELDVFSINYWGDPHNFPARLWPAGTNAQKDPYGRQKFFNMAPQMEFDILFFLQDTFIMNFLPELHNKLRNDNRDFRSIVYYPVDGAPKDSWIQNVDACDYLVAYSEFAKQQSIKALPSVSPIDVIPHGANTQDYFVVNDDDTKAFRQQFFGPQADKFVFTNVNRNQQRKDIPRTIAAFKEFRKQVPESVLYLHMAEKDQGWDLPEIVRGYGLEINTDVIFPRNFGPNQGYPRNVVNMIYNASDCILSTTLGEGFGLAWLEAMATKTPVIMPANTMLPEFITEDTGWLCKSGGNPGLYTVVPNDNEVIRPLVDVEDLVEKMLEVHNNPEEAARRAENAYMWIHTKMEWQSSIVPQWIQLFEKAYEDLKSGAPVVEESSDQIIDAEAF